MKVRALVLALVALFATSALATAQQATGQIFGKVTDQSGAVMPGVTVTLTSPILLQPLVAVTSDTGTYQFPRLEVADYTVKFELTGFKTVVNEGIHITVGFSAQVNAQLSVSTVQETITVTGASPIVDTKETGTKQTFTNELLQSIPSARDPWVILQQTAGIAMDRENIGGNQSGQQSNYVSRGGNPTNNKWTLDGVDITDMAATGGSPGYYDFDAFEEMTVNTGGVDVTQQTGGVGINLVTKSGGDKFRGTGRYYVTDDKVESNNITDAQRLQGATSGNPIQNIKDFGTEMGGPIKPGRAWIWGSFGKQTVDVGVINFYQPTAACQQIKSDEANNVLTHSVSDVNSCLNTDETLLQTTNLKAEVQLFKGNKLTFFNNFAKKERNARNASDLTPIESTVKQAAVPSQYGTNLWTTGPNPTYKAGDQYVVSDRLLFDVQWAHVGNNFVLDFHDPSLAATQSTYIISTGLNGRSAPPGNTAVYLRPVNSLNVNMNYFMPGTWGGDHSFKVGGYWRDAYSSSLTHSGGFGQARFPTSAELANPNDCATAAIGCQAALTRDGYSIYDLLNVSVYGQDSFVRGRTTIQLGVRYDKIHDQALGASVISNPIIPNMLPAATFAGADPGVVFNVFSPRLGLTYDLTGDGRTLLRANYARYYGQVGNGGVAGQINPVTQVTVRYPWVDSNHNTVVDAGEVNTTGTPIAVSGNWDYKNPTALGTANTIDPNLKDDTTDEFIVGFDREIGAGFAVGANYIWRRYFNFQDYQTVGLSPANFVATTYTAPASSCPASQGAMCPAVTYYTSNIPISSVSNLTSFSADQYNRVFNGVEVTARKRMSNHWLMNTSYSYNSTITNMNYGGNPLNGNNFSGSVPEDPTNVANRNGYQYDYATSGSGIGNVFVNAKWLFKLSGLYNLPYDVNFSAFYNARQGYPLEQGVLAPARSTGGGQPFVLLYPVGDSRLPNFQNLDLHADRPVKLGTVRLIPQFDLFNVFDSNTVQALRSTQNATNANNIQAIVAPRVARFGVKVSW
ncbi:MAG TPA: TonB-dependent receptor [Vicinamibacterales bacterium]|nr:TonB-dependent receptor [Vicinamibacterales bacterium]